MACGHRDVGSQDGIEPTDQPCRFLRLRYHEAGHLPAGMDPGVGPACPDRLDPSAAHPYQRRLQFALDGSHPRLTGPAVEPGPVVAEIEPVVGQDVRSEQPAAEQQRNAEPHREPE